MAYGKRHPDGIRGATDHKHPQLAALCSCERPMPDQDECLRCGRLIKYPEAPVTRMCDLLTAAQQRALNTGQVKIIVPPDRPPTVSSGLYVATDRDGRVGVGRTARLAIERLDRE